MVVKNSEEIKILLEPDEMPTKWYNILADLPKPFPPYLNPKDMTPVNPEALEVLFPKECVKQEMLADRYVDIPDELLEMYLRLGRPTPLYRARRLEEKLNTPAKIYYKREDLSPPGSHKPNTALAQAYYAMKEGIERLTTETGAGQWGTALAYSCALVGIKCQVFMVRISYNQKPYRKYLMKILGANVVASPSNLTEFGRQLLAKDPNHPGSLGIAISEAIEMAIKEDNTKYVLGSVLNHVLLHQTIIGEEVVRQFEKIDVTPDIMVGCVGGGSNFPGFAYPYLGKKLRGELNNMEFYAVEPDVCPSLSKGEYKYDFGDTAKTTPLIKMYTLGCDFVPPPIHAGGLRYHGAAPSLSLLVNEGIIRTMTFPQTEIFAVAKLFAETEGVVMAPETAHAAAAAIKLAKEAKKSGEEKVIVFNYSGHGLLDLEGYRHILKLD
ncbi:MAG: TrpB-like pyridoxal phosphate-dependent enzyme [Candidatus Odinarchaeia archaeon]